MWCRPVSPTHRGGHECPVLTGDLGGEPLGPGSGALFRWLLANDLVDQFDLFTYRVVVSEGARLFPDSRGRVVGGKAKG